MRFSEEYYYRLRAEGSWFILWVKDSNGFCISSHKTKNKSALESPLNQTLSKVSESWVEGKTNKLKSGECSSGYEDYNMGNMRLNENDKGMNELQTYMRWKRHHHRPMASVGYWISRIHSN